MRLLTWNLNGLASAFLDERTEAAVFLAATGRTLRELELHRRPYAAPDVILFQEVIDKTFLAHLRPHLERGGYSLFPPEPPGRAQFEVVAVRRPAKIADARSIPLERSMYGRELHIVTVDGMPPGETVRVLTAHFDSGTDARAIRLAQIQHVATMMAERSVFGGDTNLRATEWDGVRDAIAITDAWEAVGEPASSKTTWRMHGRTARFDRIWVGAALHPTTLATVGGSPLPGYGVTPSDHIGLIVDLEID